MPGRREREVHRITTAQPGPSADLVSRERTYLVMMGTRMVAIVVAVVVPGVWRWIAIAAGVFLPYIAVVLVNAARTRGTEDDPEVFVPGPRPDLADRYLPDRYVADRYLPDRPSIVAGIPEHGPDEAPRRSA